MRVEGVGDECVVWGEGCRRVATLQGGWLEQQVVEDIARAVAAPPQGLGVFGLGFRVQALAAPDHPSPLLLSSAAPTRHRLIPSPHPPSPRLILSVRTPLATPSPHSSHLSSLLTPLITPRTSHHSSLLTPHSSHSSLLTPHTSRLTPHTSCCRGGGAALQSCGGAARVT
eukprot:1314333-Rhodomonas_salina.1